MKRIIYIAALFLGISSCAPKINHTTKIDTQPAIWPDYIETTIPCEIAPMNFNFIGHSYEYLYLTVKGKKGGELKCEGKHIDMDIDEWHELTKLNKGSYLEFYLSFVSDKIKTEFQPFKMYVSNNDLEEYGLTYRRISPGYVSYNDMGIYIRNISNFNEDAIFKNITKPSACVNCHTSNKTDQDNFVFHIRGGAFGGTVVKHNGEVKMYNMATEKTIGQAVYPYWHKDGKYVAFSTNKTFQVFHTSNPKKIEVFDRNSDLEIFDADNGQLVLSDEIKQENVMETFPAFSADGNTLFFCETEMHKQTYFLEDVKYTLMQIKFDSNTGKTIGKKDTLIFHKDTSVTHPRPSYDGKYLMYTVSDYGTFPIWHKEADLFLYNFKDSTTRKLVEVNSDDSDSYHNWSANSKWFVFTSRRIDGLFTRLYIASIDDKGYCTKPFLLPQRNPLKYYNDNFYSYNTPDFAKQKTDFSESSMRSLISDTIKTKVGLQ